MEAEQLDHIPLGSRAGQAERLLWVSALALLVEDGKLYWSGKRSNSATPDELEEAFDGLCDRTWMLKRICEHTGYDAQWISEGFIRWCESAGD